MSQLRIIRRVARGALGTALAWAVAWAPVGALVGIYRTSVSGPYWGQVGLGFVVRVAAAWAIVGALSGVSFAIALALFERRGDIGTLSVRRATGFAGGAAALLGAVAVIANGDFNEFRTTLVALGFLAALGALSGAATLALARRGVARADSGDPEQPER